MKFYLAREGVAFGPYTEFQVRESVRLGIFQSDDLALAEDGKEWLEVSRLLPADGAVRERREVSQSEPANGMVQEPPTEKPSAAPVAQYHLQEHEAHFADPPVASFTTEFSRGKLAFAAGSLAVTVVCLLTLAAVLQHRKASAPGGAVARFSAQPAAVETMTKANPLLTPVSLPVNHPSAARTLPAATPEKLTAPIPGAPTTAQEPPAPAPVEEPAAASQPPIGRIEGHMLISATDGLNYEPAFVEVRLYPLAQLKPYLERRSSEASAKFEELKTQIDVAEANKERLRKASDAAFDAYVQAAVDAPDKAALERASAEAKKTRETATNTYYHLMQSREDLLSGAFYLADLPKTAEITQTDGQGRFAFDVRTEGEFAVVAGVQRQENDSTKHYYWFVPVSVASEPTKTVLLSNNNLSSQGSADSLVLTID